jgi:hypothetical protein
MIRRVSILALLFALVTVLDDGEYDDAVFVVTSNLATVDPFPLCDWSPFPVFGPRVPLDTADLAPTQYSSAADARAPPLS